MRFLNASNGIYNTRVIRRIKVNNNIAKCYFAGEVPNGAYNSRIVKQDNNAEVTDEVYIFTARIEFTDNSVKEEEVYKFFSSQDILNFELKEKSEAEKEELLRNMNNIIAQQIAISLNTGNVVIDNNTYYNALYNHYNF